MAVSTNRLERAARALVASATILCFVGCGGGGVSVESSGGSGLVAGAAGDPALPALPAVAPSRTSPADADASGHLLTRLSVVFKRDATVGDVNAVAAAAQATAIAFAQPNSPFVTLAIPRQADATALRALAARVEPMRGVLSARGGHQPQPFDLPAGVVPIELDHLLATRFPAAWNLAHAVEAGCATRKVTVIVPDLFFGAPPNFAEQTEGVVEFTELPLEPVDPQPAEAHGYQVIGTLTAKFDSAQPHGANPLPSCLRVVAVDGRGLDMLEFLFRLRDAIAAESGPVIVSSSFGYNNYASLCPDGCVDLPAGFAADARSLVVDHFAKGIAWATFAMQPSVVDRVLFVQAAGNDGNQAPGSAYPGLRDARLGSPLAIAAALGDLEAIAGDAARWAPDGQAPITMSAEQIAALKDLRDAFVPGAATARNLVLVGALTNEESFAALAPSAMSNDGADVFAVGEFVSLIGPQIRSGTSYAAPQVAGLASMLWLLDDELRAQTPDRTVAAIAAATRSNGRVAGIVDAYATLLAVDARRSRLVLRKSLLDVAGAAGATPDGVFDHLDVQAFLAAYAQPPTTADYGRLDLNGDGATGGVGSERFDLSAGAPTAAGAAQIATVDLRIEGYDVTMNEAALSDLQILCYYAYLADANGTPVVYDARPEALAERTRLLGPDKCVGARLGVTLPAEVAAATPLTATVELPVGGGRYAPAPGLLVQLAPTCAVVSPLEATTGADGTIAASVTPQPGCASISIDVVARAAVDTPVLARQTVAATTGASNVRLLFRTGFGGTDFGLSPAVHVVPPLRRYETSVKLVADDGALHDCGVFNQPCAAHWTATGGAMIDGRPDGTLVGSVGTFTAGSDFGRFSITATSLAGEFPATTDVLVVAPVGTFSVHACEWQVTQDESAAECIDTRPGDSPTVAGPRDGDGVRLGVAGPLFLIPGMLTFEMVGAVPARFKQTFVCNGLPGCGIEVDPRTVGFEVADAGADAEHLTFLLRFLQANDPAATLRWRRLTLTRTAPPLP